MAARPRLLFAWELGANFGHASKIIEVIRALRGRADVIVAARNVLPLRQLAPDLEMRLIAAPTAPPDPGRESKDIGVNYADDLRHTGWARPRTLQTLMEAWRTLFDLVRPDVLVAQFAPTALLAARTLAPPPPTAIFGIGYDMPPRADPTPAFFYWNKDAASAAAAKEAVVVQTANQALATFGTPPLGSFADLHRVDLARLATIAELDGYAPRAQFGDDDPEYLGWIATASAGAEARWRPDAERRLFAYVRPPRASARAAIEAMAALPPDWDVIVAAPGLARADAERFARPHVRLIDGLARLDLLLPACDVGLSHGSHGMAAQFVAAGAPQISLPLHAEQTLTAHALARNRLGLGLLGAFAAKEIGDAIHRVAGLPQLAENNRALARALGRRHPRPAAERIADDVVDLA